MRKNTFLTQTFGIAALLTGMAWAVSPLASATSFTPPSDNIAPNRATGGATRGGFQFMPPSDQGAPQRSTGGASRGGFVPPSENSAPNQAVGGSSRGGFVPPSDNSAPSQAVGGSSRGEFAPPSDNSAPSQAVGGSSRGEFVPPSDSGAPQHAASGASRAGMSGSYILPAPGQPVAMMPLTPSSLFGTTLESHPTILVYVPETDAREAVFSLKDEDQNTLYQVTLSISGKSEIMALPLPQDAPGLEIGQNYQWYFAIKVEGVLSPSTPYVDAWVKRIAPTPEMARQLAQGSSYEDAEMLAAQGVWYDSAALLASLNVNQPENATYMSSWQELLTSVSLDEIVVDAPSMVLNE
jgi:Domain of Unknown Function (DUF928)